MPFKGFYTSSLKSSFIGLVFLTFAKFLLHSFLKILSLKRMNIIRSELTMCAHTQLCLTLCDPMDYSLPGSSVHGIFQARILKSVAISSSGKTERIKTGVRGGGFICLETEIHTYFNLIPGRRQPVPSLTHFNKHFEIIGMILMSSLKALPLLNHLLPKIGSSVLKKTITSKHHILSLLKLQHCYT